MGGLYHVKLLFYVEGFCYWDRFYLLHCVEVPVLADGKKKCVS